MTTLRLNTKPTLMRRHLAVAAMALALLAAGCGSDDESERPTAAPDPTTAAPGDGMPAEQYQQEVDQMLRTINDARSDFFHGASDARTMIANLTPLRQAYSGSAQALEAIEPPGVAQQVHQRAITLWDKRARQLRALLDRRPFDKEHASRLLYSTDKDNLDEFYTLPYK
jgi:hypothetical protein